MGMHAIRVKTDQLVKGCRMVRPLPIPGPSALPIPFQLNSNEGVERGVRQCPKRKRPPRICEAAFLFVVRAYFWITRRSV